MTPSVTVGLNGTPESLAAAHWAAGEARLRDKPLRLVYAGEWLPPFESQEEEALARNWPGRMLGDAAADITASHPGLPITTEQVKRLPVEALLSVMEDAELLALGSRALGDINGFVFGSTALGVLARAGRPVVLVRGDVPYNERGTNELPSRDVVLGLDPLEECDALIEFAFEAAVRRKAGLRVVHTWRIPPFDDYLTGGPGMAPASGKGMARAQVVSDRLWPWRSKHPDVRVEEHCIRGRAASELVRSGPACLLVVGRNLGHRPLGPHIGPVTHAVIHHAVCPVAVVPHD